MPDCRNVISPPSEAEPREAPRPRRARPAPVQLPVEPLELVETRKEDGSPAGG